ncbi:hypothetical protein ACFP1Z_22600 [Streptomyces gamaensis]|uniref:Uncharacterized protein n=1 Tax=Streptomyces gamaensis TaxID=1763542 RepID=A0ABW0Z294_9ACTN
MTADLKHDERSGRRAGAVPLAGRLGRRARRAAVVAALALAAALLAPAGPATAEGRPAAVTALLAVDDTARPQAAGQHEAPAVATAQQHVRHAAADKPKKKKGFFHKLGVALIVVLVLILLFVVAVIVFLIWLVRRIFMRRRS